MFETLFSLPAALQLWPDFNATVVQKSYYDLYGLRVSAGIILAVLCVLAVIIWLSMLMKRSKVKTHDNIYSDKILMVGCDYDSNFYVHELNHSEQLIELEHRQQVNLILPIALQLELGLDDVVQAEYADKSYAHSHNSEDGFIILNEDIRSVLSLKELFIDAPIPIREEELSESVDEYNHGFSYASMQQ